MKGHPESQDGRGGVPRRPGVRAGFGRRLPLLTAVALAACGGNKAVQPDAAGPGTAQDVWQYSVTVKGADGHSSEQLVRKEMDTTFDAKVESRKVLQYDLNRDGNPDVWEYYVTIKDADGKPVEHLVRKEMDLNFDGKVDAVYLYDINGNKVREQLDLDFDGKFDETIFFEKGQIVRKERDLNGDGKVDTWLYYERGQLVRKERDTKGTGRVDYWEFWENGQIDRIGEDLDGDGNVDRWTRSPESVSSSAPVPPLAPSK